MPKILHEYQNVKVPLQAKEIVDQLFKEHKKTNPRIRKADVWLMAVNSISIGQPKEVK